MIMSYILVNQHNNVINWSLNQLDMLLFIKIKCYNNRIAREARRKFLARGGTILDYFSEIIILSCITYMDFIHLIPMQCKYASFLQSCWTVLEILSFIGSK